MKRRQLPYEFIVTEHARARARERFPGFKAARIIDEVRDALHSNRLSPHRPPGLRERANPQSLYAWNDSGERVYALRCTSYKVYVTTTMRAIVPAAAGG